MTSIIAGFFANYPFFNYNPSEAANRNFYRLCDQQGWDRDDPDRKAAYSRFQTALVQEFNRKFGRDENSLLAWQTLCLHVGVHPVPETLDEAQERVRATHVNLVDLTEADDGQQVTIFATEKDLSVYTQTNGLYFPSDSAEAGGLLRRLLRHVFHPRDEHIVRFGYRGRGRGRGSRGRGRGARGS